MGHLQEGGGGVKGNFGELLDTFKRDISKSNQAYPIIPQNSFLKHSLRLENTVYNKELPLTPFTH